MEKSIKLKLTIKEMTRLALLAGIWAIFEIKLGLFFRMLNIPFWGTILTFIGIIIMFIGRIYVSKRGTILLIGLMTAILKLLLLGIISILPVLAIITEAFFVEIALWRKQPRRSHFIFAGILGFIWTLFYPFFALGVLSGWGISKVFAMVIRWGSTLLGLPVQFQMIILGLLIIIHVGLGVLVGILGDKFLILLLRRKAINPVVTIGSDSMPLG